MITYQLPSFWLCKVKLKTFTTVRSRVRETKQNSGSWDSLWGYLWFHTGQLVLPLRVFLVGISRPCPFHCISINPTCTLPSAPPPTCRASSYFCSQSMNSQHSEAEGGDVPLPPLLFFFFLHCSMNSCASTMQEMRTSCRGCHNCKQNACVTTAWWFWVQYYYHPFNHSKAILRTD